MQPMSRNFNQNNHQNNNSRNNRTNNSSNSSNNSNNNNSNRTTRSSLDVSGISTKMLDMMNTMNQAQMQFQSRAPRHVVEAETVQDRKFPADIIEGKQYYLIEAELPGFRREEISITLFQDTVTIEAEHKMVEAASTDSYIQQERSKKAIRREFVLKELDRERVEAKYSNGVLYVKVPKSSGEKQSSGRRVPIN